MPITIRNEALTNTLRNGAMTLLAQSYPESLCDKQSALDLRS